MRLEVLGCAGGEEPGLRMPAFLLDDRVLLDAGTIGEALTLERQRQITHVFLSHAHVDHLKALPFFADNAISHQLGTRVTVGSDPRVVRLLRDNLFNGLLWPDFTGIPAPGEGVLSFLEMEPERPLQVGTLRVTPCEVSHPTPSVGFLVEEQGGGSLFYTGDTGSTERPWQLLGDRCLDALIVDTAFPNRLEERARLSGHLTPRLLSAELAKMGRLPARVLATHRKPAFREEIARELEQEGIPGLSLLEDGQRLEL